MRNCREVLENLSVGMHEKLPKGITKFINGYCKRNCRKVLENVSVGTA